MQSATRSLLRYPGSKARFARFVADAINLNNLRRPIFVEPFCGGASVSIALLESDIVSEIVLNDLDPLVASLWQCVFSKSDSKWLADAVMRVPLSLDQWLYQKNLKPSTQREAALKCLYLNRTSFSGVLHPSAGPIGGRAQKKWKVGCRFNREKLRTRILELSNYSKRVRTVTNRSWLAVCNTWRRKEETLYYLDPPFYHKAERLYRFVFGDADHQKLHDYLKSFENSWILSYDNAREIRELYDSVGFNARIIDNTYAAHPMGGNSFVGREVVYSNLNELSPPAKKASCHVGLSVKKLSPNSIVRNNLMRIPMVSI